jgi:hypothetical protein
MESPVKTPKEEISYRPDEEGERAINLITFDAKDGKPLNYLSPNPSPS